MASRNPDPAFSDLEALRVLRLENDWTYRELAALTAIKLPTLYQLLTTNAQPNDRTAFKIRRFLELQQARRRTA